MLPCLSTAALPSRHGVLESSTAAATTPSSSLHQEQGIMRKILTLIACAAVALLSAAGATAATPSPAGAKVYIISPAAGATVTSPVTVRFGLSGMGVAPTGADQANTGHHHLLIDIDNQPPLDQPIPKDDKHRPFGGGQTATTLALPPGKHTLP